MSLSETLINAYMMKCQLLEIERINVDAQIQWIKKEFTTLCRQNAEIYNNSHTLLNLLSSSINHILKYNEWAKILIQFKFSYISIQKS